MILENSYYMVKREALWHGRMYEMYDVGSILLDGVKSMFGYREVRVSCLELIMV